MQMKELTYHSYKPVFFVLLIIANYVAAKSTVKLEVELKCHFKLQNEQTLHKMEVEYEPGQTCDVIGNSLCQEHLINRGILKADCIEHDPDAELNIRVSCKFHSYSFNGKVCCILPNQPVETKCHSFSVSEMPESGSSTSHPSSPIIHMSATPLPNKTAALEDGMCPDPNPLWIAFLALSLVGLAIALLVIFILAWCLWSTKRSYNPGGNTEPEVLQVAAGPPPPPQRDTDSETSEDSDEPYKAGLGAEENKLLDDNLRRRK